MIVDSSAVIALLLGKLDAERIEIALLAADRPRLPAPAYVECSIVLAGRVGNAALSRLDGFLTGREVDVLAFTADHASAAQDAFLRYGKGRHPAGLNLGDCFAYALAKSRGEPLLFKGDDFSKTDVKAALQPHA